MKRIHTGTLFILMVVASSFVFAANSGSEKSETEILWDTWGVPHIFAHDEVSAFRALGWAQMQSHGNLLLKLIAHGRGRGAEYYGEESLASDQAVRLFGLYETARKWYSQQNPQFRRDMDAFAAGINEYAKEHPERLDAASKSILPVNGVDIMAHTTRGLYDFVTTRSGCSSPLPKSSMSGSNAWAIAPSHSSDGHAMLLANPHLPWGGEKTFYEAQISFPGYDLYGATLVGFPVLIIGFNDMHGWTHTVNTIDACDVYELTTADNGYQLDGQVHPFEMETQIIKVRQDNGSLQEEPFEVRRSVIGPVIKQGDKFLAVRVAGLQAGSFAGALEEWLEMGRAKNLTQFQTALQLMQMPMFNVVYADHDGHIELLFNGLVPKRSSGDSQFWRGVVPGNDSKLVWNDFLPFKDLPKTIDPPSGWLQNSNSAPWYMTKPFLDPGQYPAYVSPPSQPLSFREQRGIRMLEQDSKISFEKLLADQYSMRSELADRVLGDLIAAAKESDNSSAQQAAAVLEKWDHETNADSKGAVLFGAWAEKMGDDFFAKPFDIQKPMDTPRGLRDPNAAVAALISAADQVQKNNGHLDVPWGEVFRLHRGKYDFPGTGGPNGPLGIFDVIGYQKGKDGRFESVIGDTFMAEVEFSSPLKAKVLLTYGESSDTASPHFGDQIELLATKSWRDPWRSHAEINQHLESRVVFHANGTSSISAAHRPN